MFWPGRDGRSCHPVLVYTRCEETADGRRPAIEEFDAIVIPGGGVRSGGRLPSWVQCRLDRALELYRGQHILALSAGTAHRPPPLDEEGFPILESVAVARCLIEAGVAPEHILTETCSYDTIGNAFFSRLIHADPRGLRRLHVITSDFHLPRTEAVFNWVYNLAPNSIRFELRFEGVTDPFMPAELRSRRLKKEAESLAAFAGVRHRITSMADCHRWLFTEHHTYRAAARRFRPGLEDTARQSY